MNNELKQIKKIYGEKMMHMCRELFPSILEKEGLLLSILEAHIAPTHSFAEDILKMHLEGEFKSWIYSYFDANKKEIFDTIKDPFELMKEAGYTLYECKNEDDIQKFKHYYAKNEELCTFLGGRLNNCYVFFAVKDNVDEIRREDFTKPEREDEYGTSVISIQFSRGNINYLSIKNRYNHRVSNPDATFSNNLENIIPGLTKSFESYYNFRINQQDRSTANFLMRYLTYVRSIDDKYYRFNQEILGTHYCENNVILPYTGQILPSYQKYIIDKERYLVIDHYIFDLKEKTIMDDLNGPEYRDQVTNSFIKSIIDVGEIRNIVINKDKENRIIKICYEDGKEVKIEINKHNQIIGYENKYVESIAPNFLRHNQYLERIDLPNAKKIGSNFLYDNLKLDNISLPKATEIYMGFLKSNQEINSVNLPETVVINSDFLHDNTALRVLDLPKVKIIGANFLHNNRVLFKLFLPNVEYIDSEFLFNNLCLKKLSLPKVKAIGAIFMKFNGYIRNEDNSFSMPNLETISMYQERGMFEILNRIPKSK